MTSATVTKVGLRESAVQSSLPCETHGSGVVLREALQVVQDIQADLPGISPRTLDDYVGVIEVAHMLGVHPDALRRMIRQRRVSAIFVHGTYAIERTVAQMLATNYRRETGEVFTLLPSVTV